MNLVLHFTKLRALTFPGACTERVAHDPHVKSECEKESDSGTSVASDPARGDCCNVTTARDRHDSLYLTVRFINNVLIYSNINDPARRTKNNINAPSMFRAILFIFIYCRFEKVCSVRMRMIRK